MLAFLVSGAPAFAGATRQQVTYTIGSRYALAAIGCQQREDTVRVADAYKEGGWREASMTILKLGELRTSDGRPMCGQIFSDFIFTSQPLLHLDIVNARGDLERLSVVHARTTDGHSYWLLVLDAELRGREEVDSAMQESEKVPDRR
jgi:hypothetical protein